MSLLDSIVEGKEFNSWEEVEKLKNDLEKELSFPLMLGDCKKIESYNKVVFNLKYFSTIKISPLISRFFFTCINLAQEATRFEMDIQTC
jgi:hypothetical protein